MIVRRKKPNKNGIKSPAILVFWPENESPCEVFFCNSDKEAKLKLLKPPKYMEEALYICPKSKKALFLYKHERFKGFPKWYNSIDDKLFVG